MMVVTYFVRFPRWDPQFLLGELLAHTVLVGQLEGLLLPQQVDAVEHETFKGGDQLYLTK